MNILFLLALAASAAVSGPKVEDLDFIAGNEAVKLYVTKGPKEEPRTWYMTHKMKDGPVLPPAAVFSTAADKQKHTPPYPGSVTLGEMELEARMPGAPIMLFVFNDGGRGLYLQLQVKDGTRVCMAPALWWGISEIEAYKACVAVKLK